MNIVIPSTTTEKKPSFSRRQFLASSAASFLTPALFGQQSFPRRPNIVFIMADDLGYGDLSCYGQEKFQTPNLDRMAAEGIRFTNAYAGSTVCSPSRCALMTGLHTGHCSYRGNMAGEPGIPASDITIAEVLRGAGYRTGIFGKWGLGTVGREGYPTLQGFDRWFGYLSQGQAHNYYPRHLMDNNVAVRQGANVVYGEKEPKGYAPDLFIAKATEWLAEQQAGKPFFLYFPTTLPHANNEKGRYTGDGMEVPAQHPYADKPWPSPERGFAGMMHHLDQQVGALLTQLKKQGIDRNTLVIFTSDNGPHREGGHDPDFFRSSGPLRGIKRDLTEGGIRVPFIAWMPGTIPANQVSDKPLAFWDMLPTFATLAETRTPRGLDGVSVVDLLLGGNQGAHPPMYWEFHERIFAQAIRDGKWKAIRKGVDGRTQLYDLEKDPRELNDLASREPRVVARMEALFQTLRTDSAMFPIQR